LSGEKLLSTKTNRVTTLHYKRAKEMPDSRMPQATVGDEGKIKEERLRISHITRILQKRGKICASL